MRRCSFEGNINFLGGGDDVIDFSSLMLDNRGGVENFLEGFDKFATGLTYSWKMLKNNLQNNCSPFIKRWSEAESFTIFENQVYSH